MSKAFKRKTCAYCRRPGASDTGDHVIAREFFFVEDRANLPKVPACERCNNKKSKLETYVTAALMAGSEHPEADRYRREMVRPRLDKNRKLQAELLNVQPQLMRVNGIIRPMVALKIDATKHTGLLEMIVLGLHYFHSGDALHPDFEPEVFMKRPEDEPVLWASIADYFPPEAPRYGADLGRGAFWYEGATSPRHSGFTVWRMSWHGGIRLHGNGTPPPGIGVSWAWTRPSSAALARAGAYEVGRSA